MQKKKSGELSCSVLHNTAYTSLLYKLYYAFDDIDVIVWKHRKTSEVQAELFLAPLPLLGIPYLCAMAMEG